MAPQSLVARLQQAQQIRELLEAGEWETEPDMVTVAEAYVAYAEAEVVLLTAVGRSRAQGRSWADLGRFLGVTRQAVRQRFAHSDPQIPHRRNT